MAVISDLPDPTVSTLIWLTKEKEELFIRWTMPGYEHPKSCIYFTNPEAPAALILWHTQKIFYEVLPTDLIEVIADDEVFEKEPTKSLANYFLTILANTNEFLKTLHSQKAVANGYKSILFIQPEGTPLFDQLIHMTEKKGLTKVNRLQWKLGWDSVKRCWDLQRQEISTARALVDKILSEQVGAIVGINNFIGQRIMNAEGIHFQAVTHYLGCELIQIDIDNYDMSSYSHKAAFNDNSHIRFSMIPHVQRPWDKLYGITNTRSMIGEFCLPSTRPFRLLESGYRPLIISNSRIRDFVPTFSKILEALEFTRDESVFVDIPLWYFSCRNLLLQFHDVRLDQKEMFNRVLSLVYWGCISLMKFELIESLLETFPPLIFGDEGWNVIFPEVFQNKFLSHQEAAEMFDSRKYLRLNMNNNFLLYENNFVFQRGLAGRLPFLSSAPVHYTPDLEGLRVFEYRNTEELNAKIPRVNELVSDPRLMTAVQSYESVVESLSVEIVETLCHRSLDRSPHQSDYAERCGADLAIAQAQIDAFTRTHSSQLQNLIRRWATGSSPAFDPAQSRFANRRFFQRLVKFIQNFSAESKLS